MASQCRRPQFCYSARWDPQISHI